MSRQRTVMERRVEAAQATKDRFERRKFKLGRFDCAQMVAWHLRRIGKPVKIAKAGVYHSPAGAVRALKNLGYDTLAQVADAHFERIPWAATVAGDLVEIEADGDSPIGAMGVVVGNGRVLVYHPDAKGAVVGELIVALAGWRVLANG